MKRLSGIVFLAALIVIFLSGSGAFADDSQILSMQADIYACLQPGPAGEAARLAFAQKYNVPLSKIEELVRKGPGQPPAGNGGWDERTAAFICGLECSVHIGVLVWGDRANSVKYKFHQGMERSLTYCIDYSKYCPHFDWSPPCLPIHWPGCCDRL